jgi:SAM-dependent methyltransferase
MMNTYFDSPHTIGTRHDPHAQARAARGQPLLLHSMALFRELFQVIYTHRDIATVIEVGVESGQVSAMYAELGAARVYCVEPSPRDELRARLAANDALHLVEEHSPGALAELPVADLYVLDGDHNYATVRGELEWILANAPDAVIAFHDVLWPCSRRDLYYQPSSVPPELQHESTEDGPTVWHDECGPAGFVGLGAFTAATKAGGERNGVLTAIEDVLGSELGEGWHLEVVPAVFGMGVMVARESDGAEALIRQLRPYSRSRLLAAMENNRIALYTRVLEMQYEAVTRSEAADMLARTVAARQSEVDSLRVELERAKTRYAAEADELRQRIRELADELTAQRRMGALAKTLATTATSRLNRAVHRSS